MRIKMTLATNCSGTHRISCAFYDAVNTAVEILPSQLAGE